MTNDFLTNAQDIATAQNDSTAFDAITEIKHIKADAEAQIEKGRLTSEVQYAADRKAEALMERYHNKRAEEAKTLESDLSNMETAWLDKFDRASDNELRKWQLLYSTMSGEELSKARSNLLGYQDGILLSGVSPWEVRSLAAEIGKRDGQKASDAFMKGANELNYSCGVKNSPDYKKKLTKKNFISSPHKGVRVSGGLELNPSEYLIFKK